MLYDQDSFSFTGCRGADASGAIDHTFLKTTNNARSDKTDPENATSRATTTLEKEKGLLFARELKTRTTIAIA
jgi:hypothetical protein